MSPQQKLDILIVKLEKIQRAHQNTSIEIVRLREEINVLKKELGRSTESQTTAKGLAIDEVPVAKTKEEEIPEIKIDFEKTPKAVPPPLPKRSRSAAPQKKVPKTAKAFDLEAFIGGNLINKIGILILIVGLGLFVKYAIDSGYFSPLLRLILSFLAGLTLVGVGYRLKPKYKTYSAVLFSGGMVVLYFSTYSGNVFYDPVLIPRVTAFILMVVFTVVTVLAAIIYGLEIIALLGLVGAYAVPALLSDGSGDYKLLFSYMSIINTGVLLVSIRKNWKVTLYAAFLLTWLMFSFWALVEYESSVDTSTAWLFNLLFFFIFYAALITYNLLNDKKFTLDNVLFITFNAFIFYGLGMMLLESRDLDNYHGLFTLLNGVLHLGVATAVYQNTADKKLFYLISGLFWIFLTLTIGVQFDTEIRPLLWLGEAVLLFGLGRRFDIKSYEVAAFLVLGLGMLFLLETWDEGYYNSLVHQTVLFNRYFLTSLLTLLAVGLIFWINQKWPKEWAISSISNIFIPVLFIGVLYFTFFHEIYHQFDQAFYNSEIDNTFNYSIRNFSMVWLINYSFVFVFLLFLFNRLYLKNEIFGKMIFALITLVTFIFLTGGMFALNDLRTAYLNPEQSPAVSETSYWIWIRYIVYIFVGLALSSGHSIQKKIINIKGVRSFFQLFIYLVILVILSNELTTFMTLIAGVDVSSLAHRVGFSILWALYSLLMLLVGFKQRSKLLRIAAIVLFGLTLLKVFFVDLVDISTESRILLFVAIGVLLLLASYLYQRYGAVLLGEEEGDKTEEV